MVLYARWVHDGKGYRVLWPHPLQALYIGTVFRGKLAKHPGSLPQPGPHTPHPLQLLPGPLILWSPELEAHGHTSICTPHSCGCSGGGIASYSVDTLQSYMQEGPALCLSA